MFEIYKEENGSTKKVCEFAEIEKAREYCREHNPSALDDEMYFSNQDTWYYIRPKGEEKSDKRFCE